MKEVIYLTKKCEFDSFILNNIICKPLSEDLVFRFILWFLGLILFFSLLGDKK